MTWIFVMNLGFVKYLKIRVTGCVCMKRSIVGKSCDRKTSVDLVSENWPFKKNMEYPFVYVPGKTVRCAYLRVFRYKDIVVIYINLILEPCWNLFGLAICCEASYVGKRTVHKYVISWWGYWTFESEETLQNSDKH